MLSNAQTAFLFFSFCQPQNIVGADVVKPAQGDQMADGQLVGGALVTGVHGLGSPQIIGSSPCRWDISWSSRRSRIRFT